MAKLKKFVIKQGYRAEVETTKVVWAESEEEARQYERDDVWHNPGLEDMKGISSCQNEVTDWVEGPLYTEVEEAK